MLGAQDSLSPSKQPPNGASHCLFGDRMRPPWRATGLASSRVRSRAFRPLAAPYELAGGTKLSLPEAGPRQLPSLLRGRAVDFFPVQVDADEVAGVRDVVQRIGVEHQEVRTLADFESAGVGETQQSR